MKAAGTKQRIIEQNRYRPSDPKLAYRPIKLIAGKDRTMKRRGDLILTANRTIEVQKAGWF